MGENMNYIASSKLIVQNLNLLITSNIKWILLEQTEEFEH
jgi:hypothetical protein